MKLSKILLQSDKSNIEETPKKIKAGRLIKSILIILMLSWITLLSSCALFISIPADRHEGNNGHHGHNEHH